MAGNQKKFLRNSGVFVLFIVMSFAFNNCGGGFSPVDGFNSAAFSSNAQCTGILEDTFQNSYVSILQKQCIGCHISGGIGKGAFADKNVDRAFSAFQSVGASNVDSHAVDPKHQPPFTGTTNSTAISAASTAWSTSLLNYNTCMAGASSGTPTTVDLSGMYTLRDVAMGSVTATPKTITWSLASDLMLKGANASFPGATFSIQVELLTNVITGETTYKFTKPTLTAGSTALEIKSLRARINGVYADLATTFIDIDRKVPANSSRDVASVATVSGEASTPPLYIKGPLTSADSVGFYIGDIIPTTFAPPTFSSLISANGVLNRSCASCHTFQTYPTPGNLDTKNYGSVFQRVVARDTGHSLMYRRLTSNTASAPQMPLNQGAISQADLNAIADWINDGCPNN